MMKTLRLCLITFALSLLGCGRQVDSIPASRLIEESAEVYRLEIGQLSKSGFVPRSVYRDRYDRGLCTRADVQKTQGKPMVPLADWPILEKLSGFKRSKESITIRDIPNVFVEP